MRSKRLHKANLVNLQTWVREGILARAGLVGGAFVLASVVLTIGCASPARTAKPVYFPPPPAAPRAVHLQSFNSLHDLAPVRRTLTDLLRGRLFRPSVDIPAGIAFADGHLYLCDTGLGAVHDWNLTTGEAKRIGLSGDAVLARPVAVARSTPHGVIYVADTDRGEVVCYDADGAFLRLLRPDDREAYRPVALAVHKDKLYVADIASHQVDVFSTNDGQYVTSFGGPGADPGRFHFPTGVAADAAGNIFVAEMMNARVQVFESGHESPTASYRPTLTMGQPGDRYGDLGKPKHLSIGPDGTIFIADAEFARVHLFDARGRLLMLLGRSGSGRGATPMPVGVAVAETLPGRLTSLLPEGFDAHYFVFVANKIGDRRVSLFAIGSAR